MWSVVGSVSTGFALVAFIAASAVSAYWAYLRHKLKTIETIPSTDRAMVVTKELNAFGIDAKDLNARQQFQLAVQELHLRLRKSLITSAVIITMVVVFGLIAFVTVYFSESAIARRQTSEILAGYKSEFGEIDDKIRSVSQSIDSAREQVVRFDAAYLEEYRKRGRQEMIDQFEADLQRDSKYLAELQSKQADLQARKGELKQLISEYEEKLAK